MNKDAKRDLASFIHGKYRAPNKGAKIETKPFCRIVAPWNQCFVALGVYSVPLFQLFWQITPFYTLLCIHILLTSLGYMWNRMWFPRKSEQNQIAFYSLFYQTTIYREASVHSVNRMALKQVAKGTKLFCHIVAHWNRYFVASGANINDATK